MRTTVMSLGGSTIAPKGIDTNFLKRFKQIVLNHVKKGDRLVLVCGGGHVCRVYQKASEKLTKSTNLDKDWIGIMATRLNAELVRVMFRDKAYKKVIYDPTKKIHTKKRIIISAGFKPGQSTDAVAVELARQFKANLIINTTNTDYVYDKDPNKFQNAKKITTLSWSGFRKMVGTRFIPGMHTPFDPVASTMAAKHKMKVAVINGRKLSNLKSLLDGKKFTGTMIG
jgi:uridylate kinase